MNTVEVVGAHNESQSKYICDKCGADLTIPGNTNTLARFYCYDGYGSVIRCKRCLFVIQVEYERQGVSNAKQRKKAEKHQQAV